MNLEQQQLALTTGLLLEAGAGDFLRESYDIGIEHYSRPTHRYFDTGPEATDRMDLVDSIRRFYLAELPMTIYGERDEVFEEDPVDYVGKIIDLGIVKVTPELEVFGNHLERVGSFEVVDGEIGKLLVDSNQASRELALRALEVYRLQQSFGWKPQFTGYR